MTYKNAVDLVLPEMVKSNKEALSIVNELGLGVQNDEDELAGDTFEKFHLFYSFVLFQTIVIIFLGMYQVFVIRKKILA